MKQTVTIVKKPICPTFVHDDNTRITISTIGIIVCCIIYYKLWLYLNFTKGNK